MKYWVVEYVEKAIQDGYRDLLIYTQLYIIKNMPSDPDIRALLKPKQQHRQLKPSHRVSKIDDSTRSRIVMLHLSSLPPLSCRKIAEKLYKNYNISISYSTVSRIISHKYKPKANR